MMEYSVIQIITFIILLVGLLNFLTSYNPVPFIFSVILFSLISISSKMFDVGSIGFGNVVVDKNMTKNIVTDNKEKPNLNIINNGTANINVNTYNGPVTIVYENK